MNITEPIRTHGREHPDAVAVIRRRGMPISYGRLDRGIDLAAGRFAGEGNPAGGIVIVALVSHMRTLVVQLALARIGAAASSPALPATHAAACLIEASDQVSMRARTIRVDDRWFDPSPRPRCPPSRCIRAARGRASLALIALLVAE